MNQSDKQELIEWIDELLKDLTPEHLRQVLGYVQALRDLKKNSQN